MQKGLKYIKFFENAASQSLKSRFLKNFPDGLPEIYWRMPEVAFAVWKHLAHDKGQIGELIRLGLFDETKVTQELVKKLPGIDRIVCIYGGMIEETEENADLLNEMCDSIVTGVPGGSKSSYAIYLDEDHLVNREPLETVSLSPGGNNKLIRCKTLSGVPLMIVERMSWILFLNVDDLDKMEHWR